MRDSSFTDPYFKYLEVRKPNLNSHDENSQRSKCANSRETPPTCHILLPATSPQSRTPENYRTNKETDRKTTKKALKGRIMSIVDHRFLIWFSLFEKRRATEKELLFFLNRNNISQYSTGGRCSPLLPLLPCPGALSCHLPALPCPSLSLSLSLCYDR